MCEQAFLEDLQRAATTGPVAILLDDFDSAPAEFQRLIGRIRLGVATPESPGLVLVLAGERVPIGFKDQDTVVVKGLSKWDKSALTDYLTQAVGRPLEEADLRLLDGLLERGLPIGQVITTIASLAAVI